MNTEAQLALAASISAIAIAVADVGKAIAAHPATAADDSGEILKSAEELQGFASQLEEVAGTLNADPAAAAAGGDTAVVEQAPSAGDAGGALPTAEAQPEFVDPPADQGGAEQAAS